MVDDREALLQVSLVIVRHKQVAARASVGGAAAGACPSIGIIIVFKIIVTVTYEYVFCASLVETKTTKT